MAALHLPADARAAALVRTLGLQPHPEGGWYAEVFRATQRVRTGERGDAREWRERSALTTIYFLLHEGTHSRWHRVASDEVWHHYEGAPLELLWIDADRRTLRVERLGPVDDAGARPVFTVPAGCWQAARPLGAYALVGCSVGPGFDFADFAMLDDRPSEAAELRARFAEVVALG